MKTIIFFVIVVLCSAVPLYARIVKQTNPDGSITYINIPDTSRARADGERSGSAGSAAPRTMRGSPEEGDIVRLSRAKRIEITARGNGITSVSVRMRKLVSHPVTVRIPAGTYFVASRSSAQNMVATRERRVRLDGNGWQGVSVPAACANRSRDVPRQKDTFTVLSSPSRRELALLASVLGESSASAATMQAAVWIVTDNASYADLGKLVAAQPYPAYGTGRAPAAVRAIGGTQAARAMKLCDDAGIDITRKNIWRDRQEIMRELGDGALRQWLMDKRW